MTGQSGDGQTLIVPVGTQVVTRGDGSGASDVSHRRGAVGVVVKAPVDGQHSYRVQFPDGSEASLRRQEFAIRKQFQAGPLAEPPAGLAEGEMIRFVIYRCVVGSRAYGLDEEESDTDRRGIFLPPADLHWSLAGAPEQIENAASEECYWELQKFLTLALKANPNVLECLYTPLVETLVPPADELIGQRDRFLSQLVYQTYNGYVMSQFKNVEQDLRNHGAVKWKHAMHLIRLLLSGVTALREGTVHVEVGEHRDRLLQIRRGLIPWEEVDEWRLRLHREFDAALAATRLPERPDYEWGNAFLVRARRSRV
jgi:uncharacterized protein